MPSAAGFARFDFSPAIPLCSQADQGRVRRTTKTWSMASDSGPREADCLADPRLICQLSLVFFATHAAVRGEPTRAPPGRVEWRMEERTAP